MNTNFAALSIELLIGFIALLILTKILGKTQISQLTPFDFISALVLGELVGNAIYDKEIGVHYVLYAVSLWGTLISVVEIITQKWKRTRSFLEGKPAIVIRKGKIDRSELKKNRLDINQLQNLLRNKDVFSLQEVEYAILEANGTINVLKKSPYQSTTRNDLNLAPEQTPLPMTFITDGEWVEDNLQQMPYPKERIINHLESNGIRVEYVIVGEWTKDQPLYLQLNHDPFIKYLQL
ncbi:DUF421 domain-containing protein [Bacillus shivajii]|uniref:DUF421 domain-containing protein n=1 Tax=Bacillus shivajii TaxID=1983719 RepID=UPI001CFC3263|nr:DUF421 domain-containing protein [Bacillus shivajii]UCZ54713.1 DUF421 domain-containing protein [Bacillus shivajii]